MPFGIQNATIVTLDNITYIANSTSIPEFMVRLNETAFNGILYFVLLSVFYIILYLVLQNREDQILTNLMYAGAATTIASMFVRVIEISVHGVTKALITDYLLWIFPLITIGLAAILWITKDD